MAKINFAELNEMLNASKVFSLNEEQYLKIIGREMPKDSSYLVHKSAISRFAREKGFEVRVAERSIYFEEIHDS